MTASSSLIAPHLHAFFTTYLGQHKRASPQTVASCRDTFRLLPGDPRPEIEVAQAGGAQRWMV